MNNFRFEVIEVWFKDELCAYGVLVGDSDDVAIQECVFDIALR